MPIDDEDSVPMVPPTIEKVNRGPMPPVSDCIGMAAISYASSIRQMMGEYATPEDQLYKQGLEQIARLQPRDAVEELLMSQMLMTHARILFLSRYANLQRHHVWSDLYQSAADRAANTYRRQMETLAKYRQPRRTRRTSITTIRTAHINAKQILTQTQPPPVSPVRNGAEGNAEGNHPPQAEDETTDQET